MDTEETSCSASNSSQQIQKDTFKAPYSVSVQKKRNRYRRKNKQKSFTAPHKTGVWKGKKADATMNSWNEAFNTAAVWQYKHQVAYWKAKAKALECENRVLHSIIRKKQGATTDEVQESSSATDADSANEEMDYENENEEDIYVDNDSEIEVSQAYIEFLAENAKYKEDARREREKFKQQDSETEADLIKQREEPPCQSNESNTDRLKSLYGSSWQRISALETSLQCQFMSECDRLKPHYWPNIPFNFNFS